jgi:hypothetical protein
MALGILFGAIGIIMLNAYVTDLIMAAYSNSSRTRNKLLCFTWFIPAVGAAYSMMIVNSKKIEEQESLKLQQKHDLTAWNLKELHHLTEVHGGELPTDDGE